MVDYIKTVTETVAFYQVTILFVVLLLMTGALLLFLMEYMVIYHNLFPALTHSLQQLPPFKCKVIK